MRLIMLFMFVGCWRFFVWGRIVDACALSGPQVRRVTGEQLYVKLVTDERILPNDVNDEVLVVLTDTKWYRSRCVLLFFQLAMSYIDCCCVLLLGIWICRERAHSVTVSARWWALSRRVLSPPLQPQQQPQRGRGRLQSYSQWHG